MAIRPLKIGDKDNVKGHPFAPVQLIEYGDYECPYSRKGYRFAQMLLRKREGHIYFAFRNFPLREKHPHAQISAEAALAAGKQGYFWRMHDLLYENWNELNKQKIEGIANQIDFDMNQFKNDLKQHTFRERVATELKEGITNGVEGTPTFFINEEMYNGALNYKELQQTIDNLL